MYCKQCGAELNADDRYCLKCGVAVASVTSDAPILSDPITSTEAILLPRKKALWIPFILIILLLLVLCGGVFCWYQLAQPKLGDTRINPKDGATMVYVPAGKFLMGSPTGVGDSDQQPQHVVFLDDYWIYKNVVTIAQYRAFCSETGHAMPHFPQPMTENDAPSNYSWAKKTGWDDPTLQQHPIVNVSWYDSKAYADWAGMALPTEAQWEKAARGSDGRNFPWGGWATASDINNGWDQTKCANRENSEKVGISTWPVGSFPTGASVYGVLDMAGNVWQWCADWDDPDYYANSPSTNPPGPTIGIYRALRGGSWFNIDIKLNRSACRKYDNPNDCNLTIGGFRCVSSRPRP